MAPRGEGQPDESGDARGGLVVAGPLELELRVEHGPRVEHPVALAVVQVTASPPDRRDVGPELRIGVVELERDVRLQLGRGLPVSEH